MLTIEDIKKILTPIFEEEAVTRVILFGSYAKGTQTADSDVDLVIETEPHVQGFGIYGIFGRIADALEEINLDVDIIHKDDVIPDNEMGIDIEKSGRAIYEAQR